MESTKENTAKCIIVKLLEAKDEKRLLCNGAELHTEE